MEIRRNPDNSIDEVIANRAAVHLEQMIGNEWCLIITEGNAVHRFAIFASPLLRWLMPNVGVRHLESYDINGAPNHDSDTLPRP